MIRTKQGIVRASRKLTQLPGLIVALALIYFTPAAASSAEQASSREALLTHHVYIISSPENELHSKISRKISEDLKKKHSDIVVADISPDTKIERVNSNTDIVIGIGHEGMKSANTEYPGTKKLFISTDPNKYKLNRVSNKADSILYMTQSYCRQIRFIRQLNSQWKIISILNSSKKPVDSKQLRQCANQYGIKLYVVSTESEANITTKIKHALHHSDVLLALPDSNIYNSKTVKNILLTSYRYRKPVIAFSQNFVTAGALAAIYSDTGKIAKTASTLIEKYLYTSQPIEAINYPDAFDISINRQVFRALDLPIPDVDEIKMILQQNEAGDPGQ